MGRITGWAVVGKRLNKKPSQPKLVPGGVLDKEGNCLLCSWPRSNNGYRCRYHKKKNDEFEEWRD